MGNHKHNYGIGYERMSPATKPHGRDERGIEFRIHHMEAEAYHAVLKAFSAQSDNLTWAREALMTELRKELNITDDEHGEMLMQIKSDVSIKVIREWRKDAHCDQECAKDAFIYPAKVVSNAQQVETSHPLVSISQKCGSCSLPCTEIIPSAAPIARMKDSGGMRVKHRRNSTEGNSLVFSLKYQGQLSSDRRIGDLEVLSSGNGKQSMNRRFDNPQASSSRRSTGQVKSQLKTGFHEPGSDKLKKSCDIIKIRATDKVINQVEKLINRPEKLAPLHVLKAKLILKDHERALVEALGKLPDVSDADNSPKKMLHNYPHEELLGLGREMLIHSDFYGQAGRLTY